MLCVSFSISAVLTTGSVTLIVAQITYEKEMNACTSFCLPQGYSYLQISCKGLYDTQYDEKMLKKNVKIHFESQSQGYYQSSDNGDYSSNFLTQHAAVAGI